jgi:uncharacterized protein YeeX (DUF496 family)
MKQSKHKLSKELKRAERHKNWLGKNLPKSKQVRENQKQILALYTAIKCDSLLL